MLLLYPDIVGGSFRKPFQKISKYTRPTLSISPKGVFLDVYSRKPSLRSPKARRTWDTNCGRPILALNKDILGPKAGSSHGTVILALNDSSIPRRVASAKEAQDPLGLCRDQLGLGLGVQDQAHCFVLVARRAKTHFRLGSRNWENIT